MAFIPLCKYNDTGKAVDCELFHPVLTDSGICHSFNPTSSLDMLHQSYFKDSFKEAFKSDFIKDSTIFNGTKEGENHGLTFYLLDTSFRRLGASGIGEKAFQLQLSSKDDYFSMLERSK